MLGKMKAEECNANFNGIFIDGTAIDIGRIGNKEDNGGSFKASTQGCKLVLAGSMFEPLREKEQNKSSDNRGEQKLANNSGHARMHSRHLSASFPSNRSTRL